MSIKLQNQGREKSDHFFFKVIFFSLIISVLFPVNSNWANNQSPQILTPITVAPIRLPNSLRDRQFFQNRRVYFGDSGSYVIKCRQENLDLTIEEYPAAGKVEISFGERKEIFDHSKIRTFEINMCGASNSFRYNLGGGENQFIKDRNFLIKGEDGFDYVTFAFDNNSYGQPVSLKSHINITMDLALAQDQVEVRMRDMHEGSFLTMRSLLGDNHDGFTWIQQGSSTITGNIDVFVDGGAANDSINMIMTQDITISDGSSVNFRFYGDETSSTNQFLDNVADHGRDKFLIGYEGQVLGKFDLKVFGDDSLIRLPDLECRTSNNCVFYSSSRDSACTQNISDINVFALDDRGEDGLCYDIYRPGTTVSAEVIPENCKKTEKVCIDLEAALRYWRDYPSTCTLGGMNRVNMVPCPAGITTTQLLATDHPLNNPELTHYAMDNLQVKIDISESSTGDSSVEVNGGLGSDEVVLLHTNQSDSYRHRATISGGDQHSFKTDMCFPRVVAGLPATNCDIIDESIVASELR